jgi:hypothetical protein
VQEEAEQELGRRRQEEEVQAEEEALTIREALA